MTNLLISARNRFSARFPEQPSLYHSHQWGVLRAGDTGPVLLLLPGTLGRADIFWQQIDSLQDKARILALSYPQTGTLADWGADIEAMLADHDFSDVTILGSSLGGYVAQYFAATYPERVANLVAANTLPDVSILAQTPPYNTDIDALPDDDLMAGFVAKLQKMEQQDLAGLLLSEVKGRIPLPEIRNRLKALQNAPGLPPQSLGPAHIFTVESDDDPLVPPPVREALRRSLQPARSFVFKQGTHFPYVTQPQKYTAMLSEILGL